MINISTVTEENICRKFYCFYCPSILSDMQKKSVIPTKEESAPSSCHVEERDIPTFNDEILHFALNDSQNILFATLCNYCNTIPFYFTAMR